MNDLVRVRFSDCVCDPGSPGVLIAHKVEVVEYLRSGKLGVMRAGWMKDRFTGELVRGCYDHGRSDNSYKWEESLAYYLDKYNLELPADFLAHIYAELGVGVSKEA